MAHDARPAPHVRVLGLRTPTLPPATTTNTYVVGSGEAVLIEPATPHPEEQERLLEWLRELASEGIHVGSIWLTHHHIDHVGAVGVVREALGAPVLAHRSTVERLRGTVDFDGVIEDDQVFRLEGPTPIRIRAVHTPGHAPGHLCFYDEGSGALIAGDMVAGTGSVLVEPTDGDMALYLQSLEEMRRLAPTTLLPAHGPPLSDADAVLVRYIQHRRMREDAIVRALDGGQPSAIRTIVERVYRDVPESLWPLADRSVEAHLLKLVDERRVESLPGGLWRVV